MTRCPEPPNVPALRIPCPLPCAAQRGQPYSGVAEGLLLAGGAAVNAKQSDGWAPLHPGAQNRHRDFLFVVLYWFIVCFPNRAPTFHTYPHNNTTRVAHVRCIANM